jgi:cytochrome c5
MRWVLLLLVACAEQPMELDDLPCPTTGTTLTYENFGERFMGENCNTCHATSKSGAPSSYKFTTLDLVKKHKGRIFIRAAGPNTTMPPGPDDPPESERDQLAEWLACGAP